MRQMGQVPGSSSRTSACIGQVKAISWLRGYSSRPQTRHFPGSASESACTGQLQTTATRVFTRAFPHWGQDPSEALVSSRCTGQVQMMSPDAGACARAAHPRRSRAMLTPRWYLRSVAGEPTSADIRRARPYPNQEGSFSSYQRR